MKRIVLLQTVAADYRLTFFRELSRIWGEGFAVCCGETSFDPTTRSCEDACVFIKYIKNRFFFRRNFLWQSGRLGLLLNADLVIANGNARILSTWVILFIRRALRLKTVLWGHARGNYRGGVFLRKMMFGLSDGFIAYTETEKRVLELLFSRKRFFFVAPNACVSRVDCFSYVYPQSEVDTVLCVGRLIAAKKPGLLLEAFARVIDRGSLPVKAKLVFIGEGPQKEGLRTRAQVLGLESRVRFTGHIDRIGLLRGWYSRSICSVSPGYVGLSAIQSFAFGVLMLVAQNEPHSPEVEACREGFNTYFFPSDDSDALAALISDCFNRRVVLLSQRRAICEWTRKHYSFEAMVEAFQNVAAFFLK